MYSNKHALVQLLVAKSLGCVDIPRTRNASTIAPTRPEMENHQRPAC